MQASKEKTRSHEAEFGLKAKMMRAALRHAGMLDSDVLFRQNPRIKFVYSSTSSMLGGAGAWAAAAKYAGN